MSEDHAPKKSLEGIDGDDAPLDFSGSARSADTGTSANHARAGKPITPDEDDFDGPPPRRPPEPEGVEPLPQLADYDGSLDADRALLSRVGTKLLRHSLRNMAAAEKVDPAGQAGERLGNQACKYASIGSRILANRAAMLKG